MHNPNTQNINMAAFLTAFMTGGYTIAEFEAALAAAGYSPIIISTVISTLRTGGTTIRGVYYVSRAFLSNPYYVASAGMVAGTMVGLYGIYNYFQRQARRGADNLIAVQARHDNLDGQVVVLRQNRRKVQATANGLQPEVDELEELQANLQQVRLFQQQRLQENQRFRRDLQGQEANLANQAANAPAPHL